MAVNIRDIKLFENNQLKDDGEYHAILVQYDDISTKTIKTDTGIIKSDNFKRIRIIVENDNNISIHGRKDNDYQELIKGNLSTITIETESNINKTISTNKTGRTEDWQKKFESNIPNFVIQFETSGPSVPDLTFAAVGDFGDRDTDPREAAGRKTWENIANSKASFLLALGDLTYVDDSGDFITRSQEIGKLTIDNVYPIIGNHDDKEDGKPKDRKNFLETYTKPSVDMLKGYYSFTKGNIRFIMMDTQKPTNPNSDQYKFVEKELKDAVDDKQIKWKIVCYHKPSVVSKKFNLNDLSEWDETEIMEGEEKPPQYIIVENYHTLFDKYGVDIILSGHNHYLLVTYPLTHKGDPGEFNIVSKTSDEPFKNIDGRIFVVVGSGGHGESDIDEAEHIMHRKKENGIIVLNLLENGTKLKCHYKPNDGDIIGKFELIKNHN